MGEKRPEKHETRKVCWKFRMYILLTPAVWLTQAAPFSAALALQFWTIVSRLRPFLLSRQSRETIIQKLITIPSISSNLHTTHELLFLFAVIVLSRKSMSTSTNCYLMGLAIADLLFLFLLASILADNQFIPYSKGFYIYQVGDFMQISTGPAGDVNKTERILGEMNWLSRCLIKWATSWCTRDGLIAASIYLFMLEEVNLDSGLLQIQKQVIVQEIFVLSTTDRNPATLNQKVTS